MPPRWRCEGVGDRGELRRDDRAVAVHQRQQAGGVAQEAHVAQLVDLVAADGALAHARRGTTPRSRPSAANSATPAPASVIFDVEPKTNGAMWMAVARAGLDQVGDLDALVGEVVHGVGVVPEQAEVRRRGRHRRQPLDGRVGVDRAGRVAVLRHAPHALDAGVLGDQPLDHVHVGAVVVSGTGIISMPKSWQMAKWRS